MQGHELFVFVYWLIKKNQISTKLLWTFQILAAKRKCPRYDLELNKLLKSPEFTKIQEKLKPIYNYVSNYTGSQIYSLQELEYLYNTLYIESLYGLKLPNWTREVFPDKMRPWAHFSFRINCYTTHLQRLKMGLLVNDIFTRLISKSKGSLIPDRKMWIYSAHDTTVANILMSLGAFDDHSPPYTSLIIFELSVKNGVYYISVSLYQTMFMRAFKNMSLVMKSINRNSILKMYIVTCQNL